MLKLGREVKFRKPTLFVILLDGKEDAKNRVEQI